MPHYRTFEPTGTCLNCQHAERVGCATAQFYHSLQSYDWPGNVRELENLIIRLLATNPDEILDAGHLPDTFRKSPGPAAKLEVEDLKLNTAVKRHIERVLKMSGYNQSRAAKILGIPFTTLQSKIKKLGIEIKK